MNKKNIKISYDSESKVLSIELDKKKSVDSDVQGNAVLDYDKSGRIIRINLYGFRFDVFKENGRALRNFARHSRIPLTVR